MKNLHPTTSQLEDQDFVLLWEQQGNIWVYTKNMLTFQTAKTINVPETYWAYPYWVNPNNETDNNLPFIEVTVQDLHSGKLLRHGDLLLHLPRPLPLNDKTPVHSL